MLENPDRQLVRRLLEQDVLANVVTLKMLTSYGSSMALRLEQRETEWALLSLLPTAVSDWDRKAYPDTRYIAFVDGNSEALKLKALAAFPREPVVVKTGDPFVKKVLKGIPGALKTTSYLSFTTEDTTSNAGSTSLSAHVEYDEAAWQFFGKNGYESDELSRYFANGACWFGVRANQGLVAACFVYENYNPVWEIAGVYTDEATRRQGLAKLVVTAALQHLRSAGLKPRYQVKWDNQASIAVARSCGLIEFLEVDHYRLKANPE